MWADGRMNSGDPRHRALRAPVEVDIADDSAVRLHLVRPRVRHLYDEVVGAASDLEISLERVFVRPARVDARGLLPRGAAATHSYSSR